MYWWIHHSEFQRETKGMLSLDFQKMYNKVMINRDVGRAEETTKIMRHYGVMIIMIANKKFIFGLHPSFWHRAPKTLGVF